MTHLTEDGIHVSTFEEVLDRVQTRARQTLDAPELDITQPKSALGSLYMPLIDECAEIHEVLGIVYNSNDPKRATGQAFEAVSALRGVNRKPAKRGKHSVPMTFEEPVPGTIKRGAIRFFPEDQQENVWMNSEDFVVDEAATFDIPVESELTGADKKLLDGQTVSEILDGPSQLVGISVDGDGTHGTSIEAEPIWRARSDAVIADDQSRVGRAVEKVANVLSAVVIEGAGRITVVIRDAGADPDHVAQAIYDSKAQGIPTLGPNSAMATSESGKPIAIHWETTTDTSVAVTVNHAGNASATDIKNAILAESPSRAGETLIWSALQAAAKGVPGVSDCVVTVNGGVANIVPSELEFLEVTEGSITVGSL